MGLRNKKYRSVAAFTLIELLVVISIIALLLSILMPSLQKAKEQARKVICSSRMHQVGIAVTMYAGDYSHKMPPFISGMTYKPISSYGHYIATPGGPGFLIKQGLGLLLEGDVLADIDPKSYLATTEMLFCPADKIRRPTRENGSGWALDPPYNMNQYYYAGYWHYYFNESGQGWARLKTSTTLCPGRNVIMTDQTAWNDELEPSGATPRPYFHKDGSNRLRLDGSVNFLKKDKIESQEWLDGNSQTDLPEYLRLLNSQ